MARAKLTKRALDAKQQEAVRRQQSRTASGNKMRVVKSTKKFGNYSGSCDSDSPENPSNNGEKEEKKRYRNFKTKFPLPQPFQKKQVKQRQKCN